jgi:nitrogen regulatory protein PII
MKASEFKKILKPLVMQSVKEVLLQEGVLSNIVAEVARGLGNQRIVAEGITVTKNTPDPAEQDRAAVLEEQRQERIRKLNESNKFGDIFAGTREIADNTSQGPLGGVSPGDKGVDISDIEKIANGRWKTLVG